ncbi:MAG: endonuclease/exonuclease/phosphatase family protein [Chitinophagia bacterium]|jgi:endonuclease/exonuclease/phosphatase family metal-dependent hydrolase
MAKKSRIRNFGKRILFLINLFATLLFLYPIFFSPISFIWVNGFLGLMAPYLIAIEILLFIIWLIAKPVVSLFPLFTLVIGWKICLVLFAWHPGIPFSQKKKDNTLRIISWNVKGFNGMGVNSNLKLRTQEIAYSIQKWDPDLVCLQEYNTNERPNDLANHSLYFTKKLPYYFFSKDFQTKQKEYYAGCIIFSKYKIIAAERIGFLNQESLISVTILKGDDTIQINTTHLASYRFNQNDFQAIDESTVASKKALNAKRGVLRKLRHSFTERAVQAEMVQKHLLKSPYPTIVTGDFNDVPSSYTYHLIKGDWQDAFLEKGFGIGATYLGISPTLRIDYILANKAWEVKAWESIDENLSDHHMIMADLLLKKN